MVKQILVLAGVIEFCRTRRRGVGVDGKMRVNKASSNWKSPQPGQIQRARFYPIAIGQAISKPFQLSQNIPMAWHLKRRIPENVHHAAPKKFAKTPLPETGLMANFSKRLSNSSASPEPARNMAPASRRRNLPLRRATIPGVSRYPAKCPLCF